MFGRLLRGPVEDEMARAKEMVTAGHECVWPMDWYYELLDRGESGLLQAWRTDGE